jgi:undecaprenyl diphosphate synthase
MAKHIVDLAQSINISEGGGDVHPGFNRHVRRAIITGMLKALESYLKPGTEEYELASRLDFARLPRHIAVIMDGNGRWALRRGLPRVEGHAAAADSVRETVEACARLGIRYLTLYAFSKENWKRPWSEVRRLWSLLRDYLKKQDKVLVENDIRLLVIGERDGVPASVRRELERVERLTRRNKGLTAILALNYSGRAEIVEAVRRILKDRQASPEALDEQAFASYLQTAGIPDPDLLIRTSGEMRISNFLLWQVAYSELWITDVLWPDFRKVHLLRALLDYQKRERRFGDVGPAAEAQDRRRAGKRAPNGRKRA